MKAESIKIELIEWLSKLDDKHILTSLLQFKKSPEAGDWADNLTEEQIESFQKEDCLILNREMLYRQRTFGMLMADRYKVNWTPEAKQERL